MLILRGIDIYMECVERKIIQQNTKALLFIFVSSDFFLCLGSFFSRQFLFESVIRKD
jgi:hypothetical protein